MPAQELIKSSLRILVEEVMRGTAPGASGTWFVQGRESLTETLSKLTAAKASSQVSPHSNSIAAHVIHASYYLELAISSLKREGKVGDWPGSWAIQEVDEQEWTVRQDQLAAQVTAFLEEFEQADLETDDVNITVGMANLGHLSYHLGSIRQLALVVLND